MPYIGTFQCSFKVIASHDTTRTLKLNFILKCSIVAPLLDKKLRSRKWKLNEFRNYDRNLTFDAVVHSWHRILRHTEGSSNLPPSSYEFKFDIYLHSLRLVSSVLTYSMLRIFIFCVQYAGKFENWKTIRFSAPSLHWKYSMVAWFVLNCVTIFMFSAHLSSFRTSRIEKKNGSWTANCRAKLRFTSNMQIRWVCHFSFHIIIPFRSMESIWTSDL